MSSSSSSDKEDYDSDAPEELTAQQGIYQDEEIQRVQKENKARAARENKERRRLWAQRKTPKQSDKVKAREDVSEDITEDETRDGARSKQGMLPNDIVELLAAREKQVFSSDSEDEQTETKPRTKKRRPKKNGVETVLFKDINPSQCQESSMEFLKRRKTQVPRSSAVLNNSNQALRLLSSSGLRLLTK